MLCLSAQSPNQEFTLSYNYVQELIHSSPSYREEILKTIRASKVKTANKL